MPTPDQVVSGLTALKALPLKARTFCREYVVDFNGKQAAIRAGHAEKSAAWQGSRYLTKPQVQLAIDALIQERSERLEISGDRVLAEYARLAYFDPASLEDADGKLLPLKKMHPHTRACIKSYDYKRKRVELWPKMDALAFLGRYTKLVDGDALPPHLLKNVVVICPADASPAEWQTLAQAQVALMAPDYKPPVVVGSNGSASSNGHPSTNGHPSSNGQTPHHNGDGA